jgi:hypothetical protein
MGIPILETTMKWWQGIPFSRRVQADNTSSYWAAIGQPVPGIETPIRGFDHTPAAGRLRAAREKNDVTRCQARPKPVSARGLLGVWLVGFMGAVRVLIDITSLNVVRRR